MIDKFQSSLSIEPQPVSSRQHARLNFFYKFAAFVRVRVAYNTSLLLYLLAHLLLLLLLQFEHCACSVAYEQQHENVYPTIALQLTTWRIKCAENASATLGFYLYTQYTHTHVYSNRIWSAHIVIYIWPQLKGFECWAKTKTPFVQTQALDCSTSATIVWLSVCLSDWVSELGLK